MKLHRLIIFKVLTNYGRWWIPVLAVIIVFQFILPGCTTVGPGSISSGRLSYAEAINRTEDEQLLLAIIKGRYGETSSLLAVNGVAANIRFGINTDIEAGFGTSDFRGENLLSGGLAYEENPTITYAPIQGEQYLRQLMAPIPLDLLLLVVRSTASGAQHFNLLVSRINDLRNPSFLERPAAETDPGFIRFSELISELKKAGVLDLIKGAQEEIAFNVVIRDYAPQYSDKVEEFLDLLDLSMPTDESSEIVIPVYLAVKTGKVWGIGITTRTTFELIEILQSAVAVPEEHALKGLSINFPPVGLSGQDIRIVSSREKPADTAIAVKYRGYWFYIDETDQKTKAFYKALRTFWSISIAAAADQNTAPVLTLPVSR